MKPINLILSSLISLNLLCPSAFAWGKFGHQAVGKIAENHLTENARKKINEILDPGVSMSDISTCPDVIKKDSVYCANSFEIPKESETSSWHFINLPVNQNIDIPMFKNFCKNSNCITEELKINLNNLKSPDANKYQKEIALMFVVHLMGDLHQPLHCANDHDKGGNGKSVKIIWENDNEKKVSLHHLWDNIIFTDSELKKLNFDDFIKEREQEIDNLNTSDWFTTSIDDWALESYSFSKATIYPEYYKTSGKITNVYKRSMQKVAFLQIEKAGFRLAKLLNEIFF